MDGSIALVEFSKHGRRGRSEPFDDAPIDVGLKIRVPRRWYRDASKNIPRNEITRFPFAVLELKLAMDETDDLPDWLRPLVDSDALAPVHKFSKFIHGCAVLLPDEVQAMPYWIDDPALAPSIRATGVGATLLRKTSPGKKGAPPLEKWTEPSAQWTDPRKLAAARAVPRQRRLDSGSRLYAEGCCGVELPELDGRLCEGSDCFGRDLDVRGGMQQPLPRQRVEPKLHFANERTFVHWLHAAVVLVSFGAAAYGVADGDDVASPATRRRAAAYATALSVGACGLATYAALTFKWRAARITRRDPVEWGDPQGPFILGVVVLAFLVGAWIAELKAWLRA